MPLLLSIIIAGLYAGGFYLLLRRSLVKLILGLILIGHGASLLIFVAGGLSRAAAPIIRNNPLASPQAMADPLPQALILTAIVISFGVMAFALVLLFRGYQINPSDDLDQMQELEP